MKRPKYNNRRVTHDGMTFDSVAELARWGELKLLERAEQITRLERQIPIILHGANGPIINLDTGRPRKMIWDFRYFTDLHAVYDDTKGMTLDEWKFKRDVFANMYPNVKILVNGLPVGRKS